MLSDNGKLWSLGTSTRGPEEFQELLRTIRVEVVADVRRFPTSHLPHFEKEALAGLVRGVGLTYVYVGDDLGGYRKGGYEAYMATPGFRRGLESLEAIARERRTAILCAERLPWKCHRRFLGFELERRGWRVIHIIDERRSWVPHPGG